MIPKGPVPGRTIFSHANKMTQAYHIMLTPLCKETGLPPLAMDILLFLAIFHPAQIRLCTQALGQLLQWNPLIGPDLPDIAAHTVYLRL